MSKAERRYYVYVLFRENGIPFYVGLGQGNRWTSHEGEARRARRRSAKHKAILRVLAARGHTEVPKVKVREDLNYTEAVAIEHALIKAIGRWPDGPLTNLLDGALAPNGFVMPMSAREKLRTIHTGLRHSNATKKIIGDWQRGKQKPLGFMARLHAGNTGKKRNPDFCEQMRQQALQRSYSEETRARMSRSAKQRSRKPFSDETRRKLSVAAVARERRKRQERLTTR